ncbi:hypothetical protein SUGI_0468490 [Cryptomeria japonica]|nr:hypothetical protein SUGI_0468490 [Cryptomeria japonica]
MLLRKDIAPEQKRRKIIMSRMKGLDILLYHFMFFNFLSHGLHGCPPQELKALLTIRNTISDSSGELNSWEGNDCCTWRGVHCDKVEMGKPVYKLDIRGFGLSGNMSSSLLELKHLKHLDLGGNNLSWVSPMPAGLGSLTNITYLSLNGLSLQGSKISPVIGSLTKLNHLELSNCGLQGFTVLNFLVNFLSLRFLDLSRNVVSGSIPSWVGNMSKLASLDLSYNHLNGSIPSCLGNMNKLASLDLSDNRLNGSIPAGLTKLHFLTYLDLSLNKIDGIIPKTLGNLINLEYLDLSNNILRVGMGFSTVVMVLALNESWRNKCFELMDTAVAFLFTKLFNRRR